MGRPGRGPNGGFAFGFAALTMNGGENGAYTYEGLRDWSATRRLLSTCVGPVPATIAMYLSLVEFVFLGGGASWATFVEVTPAPLQRQS